MSVARTISAATAATVSSRPVGIGTASGFPTSGCSGDNGCGSTAANKTSSTGAAAATLAHQRQRGDGSDPVGVRSRTKLTQASHRTWMPLAIPAR
jgi:hypothetical protein